MPSTLTRHLWSQAEALVSGLSEYCLSSATPFPLFAYRPESLPNEGGFGFAGVLLVFQCSSLTAVDIVQGKEQAKGSCPDL